MILSIDAMGGDDAPKVILEGAAWALRDQPQLRFLLHGDKTLIQSFLAHLPQLAAACEVRHSDKAIGMDVSPALALRKSGRQSSMWRALESVQRGEAEVAISAGNTGVLMGMTKLVLKTLPNINRPAIAGYWPTEKNNISIVLDLGATISPSASQLVEFAVMGLACARVLLGIENPKIGLLNIGAEDIKGTQEVREAAHILREEIMPDNFYGFVEGDEFGRGTVDVIVTDGFSGNIALKTAEGTARIISAFLRESLAGSMRTKIGAFLARPAFRRFRQRMDPNQYNGGVFLGLQGLAVKSHGGCDAQGFASAIRVGRIAAQANLASRIAEDLSKFNQTVYWNKAS